MKLKVARFGMLLTAVLASVALILPSTSTAATAGKKVHWDVSLFGSPRQLTYPINDWAKAMGEATNGQWEIELHYGGVLSPPKDQLKGLKAGLYQGAVWVPMYNPGITPLHNVLELAFLAPASIKEIGAWMWKLGEDPAMVKELADWNAQMLFPVPLPQYQFMGKKPIRTVEDLKGLRIRSAAAMAKPLQKYGAVITMVPAPEIYTALQRGMLDEVLFVWTYGFGSYKLNELSKYATVGVDAGASGMQVAVNKDAWDALPKEWRELSSKWVRANVINLYDDYNNKANAKWLPIFKESGMEISTFPPAEKAKLVAAASEGWNAWAEDVNKRGLPGSSILARAKSLKADIAGK